MRKFEQVKEVGSWCMAAGLATLALLATGCAKPESATDSKSDGAAASARSSGGSGGSESEEAENRSDSGGGDHAGHDHGGGDHSDHDHGDGDQDEGSEKAPVGLAAGPDAAIVAIDSFIESKSIDKSASDWKTKLPKPEAVSFTPGRSYFWHMKTNVGEIKIRLMPDTAPMHVTSTIYLTRLGFYDDIIFHRVITQFMAQGGDPLGRGTGGPGYKYAGEFDPSVKHDRPGILSMANAGPGTDGSQFFLTFVPTPHLNGKHTIFGEVVDGMDTVKTLEKSGSGSGTPTSRLVIEKATILVE